MTREPTASHKDRMANTAEGSLAVVTGAADDDQPRVLRSARVPLPDLGRETLGNALRALQEDALQGVDAVHVVLGERRMQHFTRQLPRTSPGDAVSYVVREAQRLCGMQSAAEVSAAPAFPPVPLTVIMVPTTAVVPAPLKIVAPLPPLRTTLTDVPNMRSKLTLAFAVPAGGVPAFVVCAIEKDVPRLAP
jgi:hypothetical protein